MICPTCGALAAFIMGGVCPSCLLKDTFRFTRPANVPEKCPHCGSPLDGVFLCQWCEHQAERELRKLAEIQAFEEHNAARPRFFMPGQPFWCKPNEFIPIAGHTLHLPEFDLETF